MELQKLWYIRDGENITGPFPPKFITRYIMLGRIASDAQISLDQLSWMPLAEVAELQPQEVPQHADGDDTENIKWREERKKAARRWADERGRLDRREREGGRSHEKRIGGDRRLVPESAEILLLRQRHAEIEAATKKKRERFAGIVAALFALLLLVVAAVLLYAPVNPVKVGISQSPPACRAAAAPQINWSGCDKSGAWLRGVNLSSAVLNHARFVKAEMSHIQLSYSSLVSADLSYANLSQASLLGSSLNDADMSYADLRGADLRFADLRGARLDAAALFDARFDSAIWPDGKVCGAGSVGSCL